MQIPWVEIFLALNDTELVKRYRLGKNRDVFVRDVLQAASILSRRRKHIESAHRNHNYCNFFFKLCYTLLYSA